MNYQIFFAKAQIIIDTPVTSNDKQSAYFLPFLLLNYGKTNPEAAEPVCMFFKEGVLKNMVFF